MLVIFLLFCLNANSQNIFDGEVYYWEDENNEFVSPKKSILQFKKDTIYIIDFPMDPAGMLTYSLGIYQTNQESKEIRYEIKKSVTFSMNIGQVVWYSTGCQTNFYLSKLANGELIREQRKDAVKIGDLVSTEKVIMNYEQVDLANIPISFNWTHMLKKYENDKKLKICDEYD